jgi:hypothetical protein
MPVSMQIYAKIWVMENIKVGDLYEHSKTKNKYKVIALGKHSETLEDMVVYEAQYDNPKSKIWIRPLAMWSELVEINGQKLPRFKKL